MNQYDLCWSMLSGHGPKILQRNLLQLHDTFGQGPGFRKVHDLPRRPQQTPAIRKVIPGQNNMYWNRRPCSTRLDDLGLSWFILLYQFITKFVNLVHLWFQKSYLKLQKLGFLNSRRPLHFAAAGLASDAVQGIKTFHHGAVGQIEDSNLSAGRVWPTTNLVCKMETQQQTRKYNR
jgi:hypothetical protein